jgi:hypothetical protein
MSMLLMFPPGSGEFSDWLLPPQREWLNELGDELRESQAPNAEARVQFEQVVEDWVMMVEGVFVDGILVVDTMTATRGSFRLQCGLFLDPAD